MGREWIERLDTSEEVFDCLHELLDTTEGMFAIALSEQRLPAFESALRGLLADDVLSLLLLYDDHTDESVPAYDLEGLATIVRTIETQAPLMAFSDGVYGVQGHPWMLTEYTEEKRAIAFRSEDLSYGTLGQFINSHWVLGKEVYTHEPISPPHSFDVFRHAVIQAVLHLRERRCVEVTATVSDPNDETNRSTIRGTIVDARQSLVSPFTSNFSGEVSLTLDVDGTHVTMGGTGAFLEDYVAKTIRFERVW